MSLEELLADFDWSVTDVSLLAFIVLSLVQIAPIKINPWSYIVKFIGRELNGEVIKKIAVVQQTEEENKKDISTLRGELYQERAIAARVRILRFEDELLHDVRHSKESFDQVMSDITYYEKYCKDNPDFLNNMINITIQHIKKTYQKQLDEHDFTVFHRRPYYCNNKHKTHYNRIDSHEDGYDSDRYDDDNQT